MLLAGRFPYLHYVHQLCVHLVNVHGEVLQKTVKLRHQERTTSGAHRADQGLPQQRVQRNDHADAAAAQGQLLRRYGPKAGGAHRARTQHLQKGASVYQHINTYMYINLRDNLHAALLQGCCGEDMDQTRPACSITAPATFTYTTRLGSTSC